ncbi:MAG: hypothetical protein ACQET6_15155 [Bacillota bacterium]|uniref:hypothetical protein n=1 Tax=Rossellomorea sp. FM04394 TaxID=3243076 RepID=UPI0035A5881D
MDTSFEINFFNGFVAIMVRYFIDVLSNPAEIINNPAGFLDNPAETIINPAVLLINSANLQKL